MKVLVTGASGLLGRTTVAALRARGDEVTTLQRRPSAVGSTASHHAAAREVLGDVADPAVVAQAVAGQDAVLHLAAKVDVVGPLAEYVHANVEGTRVLVEASRHAGVSRFVQVSSPSVAHTGSSIAGVGAGPADPVRARSPYSRTKAESELIALAADSPQMAVLAVRPHLVWGPEDTQLIARLVQRAGAGRLFVLGSGAALIDTTYISDAADALVAAIDACGETAQGEALVISGGEPRPVLEILQRVCAAAGLAGPRHHPPIWLGRAAGTMVDAYWALSGRTDTPPLTRFLVEQLTTAHWFDQRRTRDVLRWQPRVGLERGFDLLAEWYASERRGARMVGHGQEN